MKKKILSLVLALVMCLGLMPTAVFAAEGDLPDWYFLFAIFKNVDADGKDGDGIAAHTKYTMTKDEIDYARAMAQEFEEFMDQVGVMRAHVDVMEFDTPVTKLGDYRLGSYLGAEQAEPLLKEKIDLDRYDHVICVSSLGIDTAYKGVSDAKFKNGTGHAFINLVDREFCLGTWNSWVEKFPPVTAVHEFLHFMEKMNAKWGKDFDLHSIEETYDPQWTARADNRKECLTDIILDRAKGTAGTGVYPALWQYPPRVLRTIHELTIPESVTGITAYAYKDCTNLTKVNIPSTVTSIGYCAFCDCTGLTEAIMLPGVTTLEGWAFGRCTALTTVTIPASVISIGECAFFKTDLKDVYFGGTEAQWKAIKIGDYNSSLTSANIHYNSGANTQPNTPTQPAKPETASPTNDKLEVNGAAADPTVYKINGSNYFKVRDVAALLNGTEKQFAVGYDGAKNAVTATTGQGYAKQSGDLAGAAKGGDQSAAASNDAIYVNGEKITAEVYKIGGNNYFKLRDLGKALNFYVGWTAQRGMYIETDKPYSE